MADAQLLQNDFSRGIRKDFPRNAMPQGSVWNAVDCIPMQDASLRERGGWSNVAATSAATASSTYITAGFYALFSAATQIVCIDEDGQLFKFDGSSVTAVTSVAAAQVPLQKLVFHNNLLIIPSPDGSTSVKSYDGSSVTALAATAPAGKYAGVWRDFTLLAGVAATSNRLFFSAPGDPSAAWDTTNDYQDFSAPIKGLATLRNTILVFHDSTTSRMRGTTPPAGGDMVTDDPAFTVGCLDARSIDYWNEAVVWASSDGVFLSDGVTLIDLSDKGDMTQYWRDLLDGWDTSWTIAGGVYRNQYFCTVMNGTTFVDSFMIDLNQYSWYRHSNFDALCYWGSAAQFDELYFGRRGAPVVATMSGIFNPASANKADGNSTAVAAVVETPFYQGKPGLKAWKRGYLAYELTDFATDNPTVAVTLITTPEDTTYSSTLKSFAETTTYDRQRFDLVATTGGGVRAPGVAFKLTRSGSGDFKLWSLEAEVHPLDGTRIQ